jgi:predicted nuclease with TOPRIM domain
MSGRTLQQVVNLQKQLKELDTGKHAQPSVGAGRTLQELYGLRDQLQESNNRVNTQSRVTMSRPLEEVLRLQDKLSKHKTSLSESDTSTDSVNQLLSLQSQLSKHMSRYRVSSTLHFQAISRTTLDFADKLGDLNYFQFLLDLQEPWAEQKAREYINEIEEEIKDLKEHIEAITVEMDQLNELLGEIEGKVLKLVEELNITVGGGVLS